MLPSAHAAHHQTSGDCRDGGVGRRLLYTLRSYHATGAHRRRPAQAVALSLVLRENSLARSLQGRGKHGIAAIDLLQEKEWPVVRDYGLICSMGSGAGGRSPTRST